MYFGCVQAFFYVAARLNDVKAAALLLQSEYINEDADSLDGAQEANEKSEQHEVKLTAVKD